MRGHVGYEGDPRGDDPIVGIATMAFFTGIVIIMAKGFEHKKPKALQSKKHKLREAVEQRYTDLYHEILDMRNNLQDLDAIADVDEWGTDMRSWKQTEDIRLKALEDNLMKMRQKAISDINAGRGPLLPEGKDLGIYFSSYLPNEDNIAVAQYQLATGGV